MNENYAEAAMRHYQDAKFLDDKSRRENADHLYGLSVECAIKSVVVGLKPFVNSGAWEANHFKHINKLWDGVNLNCVENAYPALTSVLEISNPFSNWDVSQRYCSDGWISVAVLTAHRNIARRVFGATGLVGIRS